MNAIERSRSKTDIRVHNMLEKSASKSRFLDEIRVRKSRAQSAHSMTFEEEAKISDDKDKMRNYIDEKTQKIQNYVEEKALKEDADETKSEEDVETIKRVEKRKTINPYDDAPKKMDDIFGPMRGDGKKTASSVVQENKKEKTPTPPLKEPTPPTYTSSVYVDPNFDPNKKEISGMSE